MFCQYTLILTWIFDVIDCYPWLNAHRNKDHNKMRVIRLFTFFIWQFWFLQILLFLHLVSQWSQMKNLRVFVNTESETYPSRYYHKPLLTIEKSSLIVINRKPKNFIEQLHLCKEDFQRTWHLNHFNRSLILYEVEWDEQNKLNILFLLLEDPEYVIQSTENMTPYVSKFYSVQCVCDSNISEGSIYYPSAHAEDRSLIFQCHLNSNQEKRKFPMTIRLIDLETRLALDITMHLCYFPSYHGSIGHCHKPLSEPLPAYMLQQWLDYHLLLGIEQFYIYDRLSIYEEFLQHYVKRNQVVYIPFPLHPQLIFQKNFELIETLISEMHCLMHVRSTFQWIGAWEMNQYMDFFNLSQRVFLKRTRSTRKYVDTMLSSYLATHFDQYESISLKSIEFFPFQRMNGTLALSQTDLIVEQCQYRSDVWKNQTNYLIRGNLTSLVNMHNATHLHKKSTFDQFPPSLLRSNKNDSKIFIHLNVYPLRNSSRWSSPSQEKKQDAVLKRDTIPWKVIKILYQANSFEIRFSANSSGISPGCDVFYVILVFTMLVINLYC